MVTLDRNERIRLVTQFRALCRRSWVNSDTGKHRGMITHWGADVPHREIRPRLPESRRLGLPGECCKQSVVTALDDLERLGFITRIRRIMTPLGFTTRQITDAYRIHEPTSGLGLLAMGLFATESNSWTPSDPIVESYKCEGHMPMVRAEVPVGGSDPVPPLAPRYRSCWFGLGLELSYSKG
jgi:hypothetical protein